MRAKVLGVIGACTLLLLITFPGGNSQATSPTASVPSLSRSISPLRGTGQGKQPGLPTGRRVPTQRERPRPVGVDLRRIARYAWDLFHRLDLNGDGLLDNEELPTALRADRSKWDLDKDGAINLEEFLEYFKARVEQFRLSAASAGPLPAWFREMDTDNDRNGDGLLTPAEVRSSVAQESRSDPTAFFLASLNESGQRGEDLSVKDGSEVRAMSGGVAFARLGSMSSPTGASGLKTESLSTVAPPMRRTAPPSSADRMEARAVAAVSRPVASPAPAKAVKPKPAPAPVQPPGLPYFPNELAAVPFPLNDGTNKTWLARDQQNELRLLLGGHANVVFLGDSITDWLATGPGKPCWNDYFAPLGAEDLAIAGIVTSNVLWQVETGQVALASPDVVVLMIGTNNLGLGQSPLAVALGIAKIVEELRAQLPRTRILLLGILPRGQSPDDPFRNEIAEVNSLLPLLEGDGVTFLDIGSRFLQPDGTISPFVMSDFLHPTLLGYEIYTASIWQVLMELFLEE